MKSQRSFLGILLLGIGIYFLLQQYSIPLLSSFSTWPTILIILGVAFLFNGYGKRQHDHIFPGVILIGLGIHFHALDHASKWMDHWGMYTLIVGLAFLLKAHKANQGIIPGIILILISFIALTSVAMPSWFSWFDYAFHTVEQFWPIVLIVLGLFFLFKK